MTGEGRRQSRTESGIATRRKARKHHRCQWGYCRRIDPGEVYVLLTAFPGDDAGYATHAGHPVRMALCADCAATNHADLLVPAAARSRT